MDGFREFFESRCSEGDVIAKYHQKIPIKQIASETGCSESEVYRILNRHGIEPNRIRQKDKLVGVFRKNLNWKTRAISDAVGMSERNIRNIYRRLRD